MTTRSRSPHVSPVGSDPERILQTSRAAPAENTPINYGDFVAQFARVRHVDGVMQGNIDILVQQAVDNHRDDEPHNEGIEEEERMPENDSGSESGYFGSTHDDVRRLIREALEKHEEASLRLVIDDRCRDMVPDLFEVANEQAKKNVHTPLFEVMEKAAVRAFFTGGADELLDEKMYKFVESQDSTEGLVRHIIRSSTFTVPVTRFVKQQAERAGAIETKLQEDVRREVPIKKEVTPPSPLTGRTPQSSETYKNDKQDKKKKDKTSSHRHCKSSSCSKCGLSRHSHDYEVDKNNNGSEGVTVLNLVNAYLTAALDSNNYRLQKQSKEYNRHISGKFAKLAKKMDVQMKNVVFKPSDPISVLSFLDNFKTACHSNILHEGSAMCFFPHIIKKPCKAALSHRVTADKKNHKQEGKLTTYCQVVYSLLETYATDDVIAEAEADITKFKQSAGMTAVCYSESLWEKALTCGIIYSELRLKDIIIEGLRYSICYSMRTDRGSHKEAILHSLARHAANLVKLQDGSHSPTSSMREDSTSQPRSSKSSRTPT